MKNKQKNKSKRCQIAGVDGIRRNFKFDVTRKDTLEGYKKVSAHRHRLVFCRWSGFFGAIESAQAAFEAVSVSAGGGFAAFLDAVGAD